MISPRSKVSGMPQMNPDTQIHLQSHLLQETTANALDWRICLEDLSGMYRYLYMYINVNNNN